MTASDINNEQTLTSATSQDRQQPRVSKLDEDQPLVQVAMLAFLIFKKLQDKELLVDYFDQGISTAFGKSTLQLHFYIDN